jgi:RNA polymerase sigma-70 factor (ECF subfamily)
VKNLTDSTDKEIIGLYAQRCESAIGETAKRYGAFCFGIAMNILQNKEDAEECVNDAYLAVWNKLTGESPEQPRKFSAFLGRIVRNLSLNRYEARTALKRGGSNTDLLLSELELCLPSPRTVEEETETGEIARTLDEFWATLRKEDRVFFMRRYFYSDTVVQIAKRFGAGESKVKMSLHRTRKKLKTYLEERGIQI